MSRGRCSSTRVTRGTTERSTSSRERVPRTRRPRRARRSESGLSRGRHPNHRTCGGFEKREGIERRARLDGLVVGCGLLLGAAPVRAHHAFAATFDNSKPIVLQGVVTKVEMMNPHSWFWLDVKEPDGTVVNWGFEGGSPNSLIRKGVTKETLPIGTEIIVNGYQAKSGEHKGVGVNMTFPDGRKLFFGGS